ncbi:thioredoxin domain-containing protein 12-like [Physella acuta]|uniref:thioredoxin domain-containing protein 12-like n=1 Tax=Physella acuta TaxID=109671 RepID=UPI0027DAC29C|nr:thioredoxin domain-containing protein 12-like [Physella acuta]
MAPFFALAASALLGSVSAAVEQVKTWGRINWVSLKEGQKLAKEQGKPAMIVFHKPWCRACKALRPRFANSREIEQMSNDFVMISVEDDEVPKSADLSPDGAYIPRILFLDAEGNVMKHVVNKGSEGFKYYYYETDSIVDSMKNVLKQTGGGRSLKNMMPPKPVSKKN